MWEEITAVFTIHHPHMVTKDSHLSKLALLKVAVGRQTPNCTLMDETQVNFAKKENLGEKRKDRQGISFVQQKYSTAFGYKVLTTNKLY